VSAWLRLPLVLAGSILFLSACSEEINAIRADRFANTPRTAVEVRPSAVSLNLRVTPNGRSLAPDSLVKLNKMLKGQGRLSLQTLTLLPYTPAGERFARRLAGVLAKQGLPPAQLTVKADFVDASETGGTVKTDDLMVVSEALVATVPDCSIADPDNWAISPYRAVGTLGCANRANLARMVSDPRDLIRPRMLAPGDGIQADSAVGRYHSDDVRELPDINFDDD